jgi:multidrug efflux pump
MGSSFVTLKDWKNRTAADQKLPAIVGRALTAFPRFKEALPWFLRRLR